MEDQGFGDFWGVFGDEWRLFIGGNYYFDDFSLEKGDLVEWISGFVIKYEFAIYY